MIDETMNPEKLKYWQEHLHAWRDSNLSNRDYCQKHNINIKLFSSWKTKLYKINPDLKLVDSPEVSVFVPVKIEEKNSQKDDVPAICVELQHSVKIYVNSNFDEQHLRRLINVINKS